MLSLKFLLVRQAGEFVAVMGAFPQATGMHAGKLGTREQGR